MKKERTKLLEILRRGGRVWIHPAAMRCFCEAALSGPAIPPKANEMVRVFLALVGEKPETFNPLWEGK